MKKLTAVLVLLLAGWTTGAAAANRAVVTSAIAPLLSAPGGTGAVRTDEALYGMVVEVLNQSNAQYPYVRTSYGFEGYARAQDLYVDDAVAAAWAGRFNYRVSFPHGDIAQTASTGSGSYKVGTLPKGALLQVTATGSWGYTLSFPIPFVHTEGTAIGTVGGARYIKLQAARPVNAVSTADETAFRRAIVSDALSYCDYAETMEKIDDVDLAQKGTMAAPWRQGGKTHQGMDAAGLVSMVYLLNDVSISRNPAIDPVYPVRRIDPDRAEAGDILYWDGGNEAVYLGDSRYVHADPIAQKVHMGTLGVDLDASKVSWGSVFAVPVTGVSVSPRTLSLKIGASSGLAASIAPIDASYTALAWSSSNPIVAAVDEAGTVTGRSSGNAVITVTTEDGGFADTCSVTVSASGNGNGNGNGKGYVPVADVRLNKTTLELKTGRTGQLSASVDPGNATNKDMTWKSGNTNIALVDARGKVTAGSMPGRTTITVTTEDGGKTAVCEVVVK